MNTNDCTRRMFMKKTVVSAVGIQAAAHAKRRSNPNILFIMTDQQFGGAMRCAGNTDLRTPAMDRLAANGTVFMKAYCTNPVCVPSRVSMFSGRMAHEMGVYKNMYRHKEIENLPMIGRVIRDAGYDTGYCGKWHLLADRRDEDTHGFDYLSVQKDPGTPDKCIAFLKRERKKPFFLVASFFNPHDICQWARGDDMVNGDIPPEPAPEACPALPANHAIPPDEPDIVREVQEEGRERLYPTKDWTADKWRQYRWAYYRMVELVDRRIGEVLDALRDTGQEENTLIVFVSDHGDGHGAHDWNQKQVLYEEVVRVPLIICQKGVTRPGIVDKTHLVATGLDIFPTICDYAKAKPPSGLRGHSLRDVLESGDTKATHEFVVSETEFGQFHDGPPFERHGPYGRMVRTATYKYIVYSEGDLREQLFNMETDPGEMTNLAVCPEHKDTLDTHRRLLIEWCKDTKDDFPTKNTGETTS